MSGERPAGARLLGAGLALLETAVGLALVALSAFITDQDLRLHPLIPIGDTGVHLTNSASLFNLLTQPVSPWERLGWALGWRDVYPPVVYLVTCAVYCFSALDVTWACLGQLFWVSLLVASLYSLARSLSCGRFAAWLAVALTLFSPLLVLNARIYMLDVPAAAMVVCALALLVASRGFARRSPSLGFGAALGVAALTKWSTGFYLLPALALPVCLLTRQASGERRLHWPVTWLLTGLAGWLVAGATFAHFQLPPPERALLPLSVTAAVWLSWLLGAAGMLLLSERLLAPGPGGPSTATRLRNLLQALVLTIFIAAPYYLLNMQLLERELGVHSVVNSLGRNVGATFMPNLVGAVREAFPGLPLLLVMGLLWTRVSPAWRSASALVWIALGGGVTLSLALLAWGPRYLLPALPLAVLLALSWISDLQGSAALRRIAWAFLAVIALHQIVQVAPPHIDPSTVPKVDTPADIVRELRGLVAPGEAWVGVYGEDHVQVAEESFEFFSLVRRYPLHFRRVRAGETETWLRREALLSSVQRVRALGPDAGVPPGGSPSAAFAAYLITYVDDAVGQQARAKVARQHGGALRRVRTFQLQSSVKVDLMLPAQGP